MADKLNLNANLYKRISGKEVQEDSPVDMGSFHEEITILKTEVKEEVYDFEMPVDDMEFINVKEEYSSSVGNNFEKEDLEVIKSGEQSFNENNVFGNCEFSKTNHQESMYACELCHTDFEEEISLKRHYEQCPFAQEKVSITLLQLTCNKDVQKSILKHSTLVTCSEDSKKYKCKDCKYATHKKKYLTKHISIHTNERPFKCTYKNCNCTPEQKESCECNMCGYASKEDQNLKVHILLRHSEEPRKYKCSDCEYSTHMKGALVRHIRIHTNERPFKCTYKNCKCTPKQKQFCECDTCGYASKGHKNLKIHILLRHSEEPKKYNCTDCNYSTHMKANLLRHARIHTNERPFQCTYKNCKCTPVQRESCECDTCGYAATQKSDLQRHVLIKHSTELKYKCRDCNYATHTKVCLMRHIRTHTNERPFKCTYKNCKCTPGQEESCKCDMCGYASVRNHDLKKHILVRHSAKPKMYRCVDCKFATHIKRNLEVHFRTHTKDRPFKCTYKNCKCTHGQGDSCTCDMCEYAAVHNHDLKKHILVRHSAEPKKYKCTDCKFATHIKGNLEVHFRTHTNDRPFKCTYKNCKCTSGQEESCECNMCEYAAARKDSLESHIKSKHDAGVPLSDHTDMVKKYIEIKNE